MNVVSDLLERKWVLGVGALVLGLALGVLYGWVISPVQWIDGESAQLREDLRVDYLRMVIDSYSLNQDENLAVARYETLREFAENTVEKVGADPGTVEAEALQNFQAVIGSFAVDIPEDESPSSPDGGESDSILDTLIGIAPYACGVVGVLALVGLGVYLVRRRIAGGAPVYDEESMYDQEPAYDYDSEYDQTDVDSRLVQTLGSNEPIATFRSTYSLGDDLYDDSFSIEGPSGDFLGECGVGIGDIIGVGEPKKVSAFEVWLFDKNDIQTVTKVLLSSYAFQDQETLNRLSTKGDPILAENGELFELTTESLRLEARIVDITFGEGALPSGSYFERMAIELRAWKIGY
ncbi:MAG: hypothetical protein KAH97_04785 [Anaerolineales bacterium]|nr:hypothetical protein [Anaerolineales bacterium]